MKAVDMYAHNVGRGNGYAGKVKFSGDAEQPATCVFCGAKTKSVHGRYAWHNCRGFTCPATDKTPAEAALIEIDGCGRVVYETNETEPAN